MVLDRRNLSRCVIYIFAVVCNICDVSISCGQTCDASVEVAEIKVAVSVAVRCPVYEKVVVSLDEPDGIKRLGVLLIVLCQESLDEVTCRCIIEIHSRMLLAAVDHLDDQAVLARSPADVGEITVISEVVRLDVDSLSCSEVIYAQIDFLRVHSGHRILYLPQASGSCRDVQKREGGHLAFVLAVECELVALRRPEDTSVNAEFVSADELTIRDLVVVARCNRFYISFIITEIEAFS